MSSSGKLEKYSRGEASPPFGRNMHRRTRYDEDDVNTLRKRHERRSRKWKPVGTERKHHPSEERPASCRQSHSSSVKGQKNMLRTPDERRPVKGNRASSIDRFCLRRKCTSRRHCGEISNPSYRVSTNTDQSEVTQKIVFARPMYSALFPPPWRPIIVRPVAVPCHLSPRLVSLPHPQCARGPVRHIFRFMIHRPPLFY